MTGPAKMTGELVVHALRPIEEVVIHGHGPVDVDGVRVGRVECHGRTRWLAVAGGWSSGWHRTRRAAAEALVRKFYGQGLPS